MGLQSLGRGGRGLWAYPVGAQTRSWILTYNSLQHSNNPSSLNHSFITQLVKYVLRGQGGPPFNRSKVSLRKPRGLLISGKVGEGESLSESLGPCLRDRSTSGQTIQNLGLQRSARGGRRLLAYPVGAQNTQLVSEAQQHNAQSVAQFVPCIAIFFIIFS